MTQFWNGFFAPPRAALLIMTSPRLLTIIAIPLLINIGLYVLFFHYGQQALDHLVTEASTLLIAHLPPWLASLSTGFLKILGWIIMIVLAALSFTIISGIVCSPFNDLLSKATKKQLTSKKIPKQLNDSLNIPVGKVIRLEAKRMCILLAGAIVTMVMGIIPFFQIPAFMIGAWLVAFEYFGYPISHHSEKLTPVALFTTRHLMTSFGFGTFLLLLMALPFTSIIYIPLAVVGGTMLYCQKA